MRIRFLVPVLAVFVSTFGSNIQAATVTRTAGFDYDAAGLLAKEIVEPGDSDLCLVTTYGYDEVGNKTGATTRNCASGQTYGYGAYSEAATPTGDAVIEARTSTTGYDAQKHFPTSATNALNQTETRVFDARFGTVTSLTGPNGLTTTWAYDGFGRKTLETRADGNQTEWAYFYCAGVGTPAVSCPAGLTQARSLVQATPRDSAGAQNGPVTRVYYDMLGREIRTETQGFDGSGTSTAIHKDTEYDAQGRIARVSRPYYAGDAIHWTTFGYDILGRVTQETQPATGSGTIRSVTAYSGLTTTVTVSNNGDGTNLPEGVTQAKTTVKNSQGQVVLVTDAQGNNLTYAYDPFGNLLTTNAGGVTATLTYDTRGRKTSMTDPDMGYWTYGHNALGELVRQCDPVARALNPGDCTDGAGGTATRIAYDKLGRMTGREERDLASKWFYDAYPTTAPEWDPSLIIGLAHDCAKGVGKLCYVSAGPDYRRLHTYDGLGRPAESATRVDTKYVIAYGYDANGRLAQTTYPTGFVTKNVYTALGYLHQVTDGTAATVFWQANALSATGRVLTDSVGAVSGGYAGSTTARVYDALDRVTGNTVNDGAADIQHFTYQYDTLGNLLQRVDVFQSPDLVENFVYDRLNRLTESKYGTTTERTYAYSTAGNLTAQAKLGTGAFSWTYSYLTGGSTKPHAVSSIAGTVNGFTDPSFTYDANGNLTAGLGRTLTYTSFNMPATVTGVGYAGGTSYGYEYAYNAEHERVKLVQSSLGTFIYLHPAGKGQLLYEKQANPGPSTRVEHKHYITAGALLVGVYYSRENPNPPEPATETRYFHHDPLGSITLVTNESGAPVERLAYEAYGHRRYPNGTPDPTNALWGQVTDRGFTSHEHLDEIALIHMNGRVYDPVLGRFMTPDVIVEMPGNLQSYNRYSYTINNPLAYTDPSGNCFVVCWAIITIVSAEVLKQANVINKQDARLVQSIAGAALFGPKGLALAGQTALLTNSIIGGFVGGLVGGGTLESGLHGALAGGLFNWAGGLQGFEQYAGHALAGCAMGEIGDSGCGRGAASAVAGKFATNVTGGNPVAAIVIGGTVSVIGGAKFSNGARTAAFGYLFNALSCRADKCIADATTTRADLDEHWRGGSGKPVEFEGSKINLDFIRAEDLTQLPGTKAGLTVNWASQIFSSNPQAQMFGSMTGVFESRDAVRLYDRYEFESHGLKGWLSDPLREAFTLGGRLRAGPGVPFDIRFIGATPIPRR